MRMRDLINIVENADPLASQPLGTIVAIAPSMGQPALFAMKMANDEWHKVTDDGYEKGVPKYTYDGEPVDLSLLHKAMADGRLSRPIEGIKIGDRIRVIGAQVHALPDGATTINPATGQEMEKRDGKFVVDGKELPDWAFTPTNTVWQS